MFGHVETMLVVNCVLFMLITLYLEQVSPGPFGTPRPWYFPFQSEFWCPDRKSGDYPFLNIFNFVSTNTTKSNVPTLHL